MSTAGPARCLNQRRKYTMKVSQAFPSKYLTAADLQGKAHKLKMGVVELVDVGSDGHQEMKPLLRFVGAEKGLVLNQTNANCIAEMHGDDMDFWAGKEVTIIPTTTDFRGRIVPCIRVQPPGTLPNPADAQQAPIQPAAPSTNAAPQPPATSGNGGGDLDDNIPFSPCM